MEHMHTNINLKTILNDMKRLGCMYLYREVLYIILSYSGFLDEPWLQVDRLISAVNFHISEQALKQLQTSKHKRSLAFLRLNCQIKCNVSEKKTSWGVLNPRHLRGLVFNSFWIQFISESMNAPMSHPLGRYSLTNPLVFSLVPLSQGWCGNGKKKGAFRLSVTSPWRANSFRCM